MKHDNHNKLSYQLILLGFARTRILLLGLSHLRGVPLKHWQKLLLITITSLASLPLRLFERVVWEQRIKDEFIKPNPIFVIGHWRSGTTYLHNIISQDHSLGYSSMYYCMAPEFSLVSSKRLNNMFKAWVPSVRPMDNIQLSLDLPQEDEVALTKMMHWAGYMLFVIPKFGKKFLHLNQLREDKYREEFKSKYRRMLAVISLRNNGRELVLKNPVNTLRIKTLLEMFPGARFIYIYRNPYDVYSSTKNMYNKILPLISLSKLSNQDQNALIDYAYKLLMESYFESRHLIPGGQLAELRFEDLENNPIGEIKKIYESIGLFGFDSVISEMESYIATQKDYKKNNSILSDQDIKFVNENWGEWVSKLGYRLLS